MKRLLALALLCCSCAGQLGVRDAYLALEIACAARTLHDEPDPELDKFCAELRDVCVDPAELRAPPPAYGNKVL
jgi:hypothetical protein